MKLYRVSEKYGRSPYQISAYVEADTPKKAIAAYVEKEFKEKMEVLIADGHKFRAVLSELPERFWQEADYMRAKYIKAEA